MYPRSLWFFHLPLRPLLDTAITLVSSLFYLSLISASQGLALRARAHPLPRDPSDLIPLAQSRNFPRAGLRLLLLLFLLVTAGMLPPGAGLIAPARAEQAADSPSAWEAQRLAIEKRLASVKEELAAARSQPQGDGESARSQGSPESKLHRLRQALVALYKQELDTLAELQTRERDLVASRQALSAWQPPPGNPPWPLIEGDEIHIALFRAQEARTQVVQRLAETREHSREARAQREEAQANYRLEREKQQAKPQNAASRPDLPPAPDLPLTLARIEAELADERLYFFDLEEESLQRQLELKDLEIEGLQRRLNHFAGRFVLGDADLARITGEIDQQIAQLQVAETQTNAELDAAQAEVERLRVNQGNTPAAAGPGGDAQAEGRRRLEMAQAEVERWQFRRELLRNQTGFLDIHKYLWELRASLYGTDKPDHTEMLKLATQIEEAQRGIEEGNRYLHQVIDENGQKAHEARKQLALDPPAAERERLTALYTAAISLAGDAREGLEDLKQLTVTLRLVSSEIDQVYRSGTALLWLRNLWVEARLWVAAIWNYELLPVEETVRIEGREVQSTRSVTVGKSIGAVLILIVGYLLISGTIRLVFAVLVKRLGLSAASASLAQRWLRLIAVATLVLLSVHLVDIPMKVFAFMGGALAIAAGFGAQTLLKNLISGIMLLAERPVRVGDLVEVGTIRGRISTIGIRVSTISTSKGMEMLIPNSMLVEEKLINWTYSNHEVRWEIPIGVAYGSDVNQVTEILIAQARAHPAILDQPAPLVLFEEFADSALIFTLRFWLRMVPGVDERRVASDLRYAILAALTAAAIDIPFPQRQVHLGTAGPLEIRMVGDRA